jgi:DNA-binding IclR family transcriptional regulator
MPSLREIAAAAGINSPNPAPYLDPLTKKGYLEKGPPGTHRGLRFTKQAGQWLELYKEVDPPFEEKPRKANAALGPELPFEDAP